MVKTNNKEPLGSLADYQRLFERADIAMIVLDQAGYYLDYNRAYYHLMGYSNKEQLLRYHPKNVSPACQPDGQDSLEKANKMIAIAFEQGSHSFEWQHQRPDGFCFLSYVTLDIISYNNQSCLLATIRDISEQRKLERLVEEQTKALAIQNAELEHLSSVDPLTGLFNRRKFDAIYSYLWQQAIRNKCQLGVLFIDVDFFKLYNDNYGHLHGDTCLQRIANVLKKILKRKSDIIARYGGEEFIMLVYDCDADFIQMLAEQINQEIRDEEISHDFSQTGLHVTVSVGAALCFPEQYSHNRELIDLADKMLYLAKKEGKNCYKFMELPL